MSVKSWADDSDVWDEMLMQMVFQDTLQATIIFLSREYPLKESESSVKVFG
jgi:hypothetical protein